MAKTNRTTNFNSDVVIKGDFQLNTSNATVTINQFITQTEKALNKTGNAAKKASEPVGILQGALSNMGMALKNILAYSAVNTMFSSMAKAISSAVTEVIEYDKAIEELQKVTGAFTESELQEFSSSIAEIGEELSATMTDITNAVTTFVKTGATLNESKELAKVAIMMQHTADETLEASTAAETLIAITRAYPDMAEDTMHISDAINNVSANYAISSGQIITNFNKVAATMAAGNTSFEETLGLITGITEVTRNASKAANALKTIGQRIRGVGEDAEEGLQASLQQMFDQYGINIQIMNQQTGEMASTFDILKAIADRWDTLTEAQKQNIGETAAGKNRITEFNALMLNFNQTLGATEAALNSAGTTAQQFAIYEDSIEGRLASLKEKWQELVTDGGTINKFIKLVLKAGTTVLKFANSDIGKLLIRTVAISQALKIVPPIVQSISGVVGNFVASLIDLPSLFRTIKATGVSTMQALTAAVDATTISVKALQSAAGGLFALLLSIVMPYIMKGIDAIKQSISLLKEFNEMKKNGMGSVVDKEAVEEEVKTFEELMSELNNTESSITAISDKLDELHSKDPSELTNREKALTAEYQKQLDILIAQRDMQQRQAYEAFQQEHQAKTSSAGQQGLQGFNEAGWVSFIYGNATDEALDTIWQFYNDAMTIGKDYLQEMAAQGDEWAQYVLDKVDMIERYGAQYQSTSNQLQTASQKNAALFDELSQAITEFSENGIVSTETISRLKSAFPELSAVLFDANGNLTELGKTILSDVDAASQLIQSFYQVQTAAGSMNLAEAKNQLIQLEATFYATAISARTMAQAMQISNLRKAIADAEAELFEGLKSFHSSFSTISSGASSASHGTSQLNDKTKELDDATQQLTKDLKSQADALREAADLMVSKLDEEIDYWEKQKDAVNEANDAIDEQIALQEALADLARAKNKKVLVFKDGQLQYGSDVAAVTAAQKRVDELQRKKQQQDTLDAYDAQIEKLKAEQEQWKNVSKAYDDYLGAQNLGIDKEAENWENRIGQAEAYYKQYLTIMKAIAAVEEKTMSLSKGQSILSASRGFASSLPISDGLSTLIDPMTASSTPTWTTANSLPVSSYTPAGGNGITVVQQFGDIVLPNVANADQFVNELSHYTQYAVQAAISR